MTNHLTLPKRGLHDSQVSKYHVFVDALERVALPVFDRVLRKDGARICIFDDIGGLAHAHVSTRGALTYNHTYTLSGPDRHALLWRPTFAKPSLTRASDIS